MSKISAAEQGEITARALGMMEGVATFADHRNGCICADCEREAALRAAKEKV